MKYFFDNITKFDTVWYGFIKFEKSICILNEENKIIQDYEENKMIEDEENRINDIENRIKEMINDIIIEIADVNFYINYLEETIYLSLENDGFYYDYTKFEKEIRPIITKISEVFNNKFINGEFTGIEYKPDGVQYKYRLQNDEANNKYTMKKRILNWKD